MVKVKDLEENKNDDIEDQILRYQLLISTAAGEINIKDDVFNSEDQFSEEEEASTSDKEMDINSVKTEPETYSPSGQTRLSDAPENPDYNNPDYLSMYCEDNTPVATTKEENDELHEGFQCVVCSESIIGFRYTCVQCSTFDMCVACEMSGAHAHHYVLRIPGTRPFKNVEAVLVKIRSCLGSEVDPLSSVVMNNLYKIRLTDELKNLNAQTPQAGTDSNLVDEAATVPDGFIREGTTDSELNFKSEDNDNNNGKSNRRKSFKQPHVKKPLNAFMLFLKEMRTKIPNENEPGSRMMIAYHTLIGRQWHKLTDEERAVYYEKAREERRLHKLRYPNYKVSTKPKKKRRRTYVKENGEHKKCRATYGLAYRHQWCTGCKRKKKCQRYMDALAEEKVNVSSLDELEKVKLEDTPNETEDAVAALNSLSNEYINQRLATYLKCETSPLSVSPNDSQT